MSRLLNLFCGLLEARARREMRSWALLGYKSRHIQAERYCYEQAVDCRDAANAIKSLSEIFKRSYGRPPLPRHLRRYCR